MNNIHSKKCSLATITSRFQFLPNFNSPFPKGPKDSPKESFGPSEDGVGKGLGAQPFIKPVKSLCLHLFIKLMWPRIEGTFIAIAGICFFIYFT